MSSARVYVRPSTGCVPSNSKMPAEAKVMRTDSAGPRPVNGFDQVRYAAMDSTVRLRER